MHRERTAFKLRDFSRSVIWTNAWNHAGWPIDADDWESTARFWKEGGVDIAGMKLLMSPKTAGELDRVGLATTRTHDQQGWNKEIAISGKRYRLEVWSLLPDGEIYGIPADIVIDSGGKWRTCVRERERECFRIYNFMT